MKRKTPLATLLVGLAIAVGATASVPTFAAGTSSPPDAKSAATLPAATNAYANAAITTVQVEPSAIAGANYIVDAKADFKSIADAKVPSDPDWKTISAMRGVIDGGPATPKTALVNGSAQGGGSSVKTTLAAGSGSSTAAPAIGYTVTDLAKLTKPDGSVTRVTA